MTGYWKWLVKSLRKVSFYRSSFWQTLDIFGYWKWLFRTLRETDPLLIKTFGGVLLITLCGSILFAFFLFSYPLLTILDFLLTVFFGITWVIYCGSKI